MIDLKVMLCIIVHSNDPTLPIWNLISDKLRSYALEIGLTSFFFFFFKTMVLTNSLNYETTYTTKSKNKSLLKQKLHFFVKKKKKILNDDNFNMDDGYFIRQPNK